MRYESDSIGSGDTSCLRYRHFSPSVAVTAQTTYITLVLFYWPGSSITVLQMARHLHKQNISLPNKYNPNSPHTIKHLRSKLPSTSPFFPRNYTCTCSCVSSTSYPYSAMTSPPIQLPFFSRVHFRHGRTDVGTPNRSTIALPRYRGLLRADRRR